MAKKPWDENWDIVRGLGEGGQGRASLVKRRGISDEPERVLKVLKNQSDGDRRARMYREVAALLTLRHEAVPTVVDHNTGEFLKPDVPLFVVMDYMPGITLADAIAPYGKPATPWDADKAIAFVLKLLDVVGQCHKQEIVHRDLKPDNVIVRPDGSPAVLDFGLSFNKGDDQPTATMSGQQLGNRFLHLPELLTPVGQAARDPRSDLTFVCGLLFFALTGRQPTVLEDEAGKLPHARQLVAAQLARLPASLRPRILNVLDTGFRRKLSLRWQTAADLTAALEGKTTLDDPEVESLLQRVNSGVKDTKEARLIREGLPLVRAVGPLVLSALKDVSSRLEGIHVDLPKEWTVNERTASGHCQVSIKSNSLPRALLIPYKASVVFDQKGSIASGLAFVLYAEAGGKNELIREAVEQFSLGPHIANAVAKDFLGRLLDLIENPGKKPTPVRPPGARPPGTRPSSERP